MPDASSPHLLICHDGTEHSDVALRHAAALWPGTRATILHVSKSIIDWGLAPRMHMPDNDQFDEWVINAAQERLDTAVARAADLGLVAVGELRTTARRVWKTVLKVETEFDPDLVVVGQHARGEGGGTRLGSVAQGLASHGARPLLVVHPADDVERTTDAGTPIIIGYDDSDGARHAVDLVARTFPGCRVMIAAAWEPLPAWVLDPPPSPASVMASYDQRVAMLAESHAEIGEARARAAGLRAEHVVLDAMGGVPDALVEFAAANTARMVVLGARARGGLPAMLGSVAHAVVAEAPVPVLLTHPPRRPETADADS